MVVDDEHPYAHAAIMTGGGLPRHGKMFPRRRATAGRVGKPAPPDGRAPDGTLVVRMPERRPERDVLADVRERKEPVMNLSVRQKVGIVIAVLISLANIASVASPTPDGEVGPPLVVLVVGALLGAVGIVGAVFAWRTGARWALRVVAGAIVLDLLGALPAFFVPVPAMIKVEVGIVTLVTVLAVVLLLSPAPQGARGRAAVEDSPEAATAARPEHGARS